MQQTAGRNRQRRRRSASHPGLAAVFFPSAFLLAFYSVDVIGGFAVGTFILTWNPDAYDWEEEGGDYEGGVARVASGATIKAMWSMGARRYGAG